MEMKWHPIRSVADNPKESGKYLVTAKTWRGELVVEIWNYVVDDFGKDWLDERGLENYSAIAWMPMPAPYRPEKPEKEEA